MPPAAPTETPLGIFTVSSAYSMELRRAKLNEVWEASCTDDIRWSWLWKLNIPGVVRHFIWMACNEALPTKLNPYKRKDLRDSLCEVCRMETEPTTHILWECPFANYIWSLAGGRLQKCKVSNQEFHLVSRDLFNVLSKEEMEIWAVTAWSIWNARNALIHEGTQFHPSIIFDHGMSLLRDHLQAQAVSHRQCPLPIIC